jgi:PIN domain nuclease of toxin-antitoxin system
VVSLDTHVLVHALTGNLNSAEQRLLRQNSWSISAIVLWELAKLRQLGRIELDLDRPEFVRAIGRLHAWPLTLEVARASTRLDFRGDPADELIAATSVVHNVPLLTRDRKLRASEIVPIAY